MGNSAAGRLTSTYFGTAATALGAAGGTESQTLTANQIPVITPSGTVSTPTVQFAWTVGSASAPGGSNFVNNITGTTGSGNTVSATVSTPTFTGTAFNSGGGQPHPIVPPMLLVTNYIKL